MPNPYFRGLRGRLRSRTSPGRRRGAAGLLVLFLLALSAQAQRAPSFFADDAAARQAAATSPLAAALRGSRALTLDAAGLRAALATAPLESQPAGQPLLLTLPLPDGTSARFRVLEAPILEPGLAARFPAIKTYVGLGVDDPAASVRLDFTPRGFHAQVLSAATGDFFIDPATRPATQHYLSYWKQAMPDRQFACAVTSQNRPVARPTTPGASQRTVGPTLRTYRLAVATTAEYTAYQNLSNPQAPAATQVAVAFAAVVTTVNRVVGVYEKELSVRMVLVANSDQLVYTDATTDPYTNANSSALLTQNQANIDAVIGPANYDIGHVFSTAGGGLADLGVVCLAGYKAQGETGTSAPVGDGFDIDYVAHEMGHQFGADHTFDGVGGSCGGGNRNPTTAYEPGSGTTIMAYAGICGAANDIQTNSDAYFHVVSYEEIQAYLATTSCAASASTGNTPPSIRVPASGHVLPIGTPFRLTASGYDSDGDAISYCWEEFDRTTNGNSPTATQVAGVTEPLFRSFPPTPSPTRYFPRLSDVINNTSTLGERLPTVARDLNFRVTVRDQHNGTQGIVGGLNSSIIVQLSATSAAGPFLVTAPNTAVTWAGGSTQAVTWDVAGTTANNVNCALVNIRLSTDGGLTYPTLLLAGTANDGSETVAVPSVATTTARIMVEAADNYFFDISNANFTITAAPACDAPTALAISNITATTASLSFAASSSATGYVVTTTPATTTQTVTASPVALAGLSIGTTYTVNVQSSCASSTASAAATTTFSTTPPPVCNEVSNVTFSNVTGTSATVSFTATSAAASYTITTIPVTTTQTITGTTASFAGLTPGVAYTVNIVSACASGGVATVSATFGTQPTNDECPAAINLVSGTACVATAGSVSGATQSQGPATCSGAASTSAYDVWYTFVATSAAHTVTLNSDFDGVVQVLAGPCGSLTSVDCVDVNGPGIETLSLTTLVPNTRYYVRVYPYTENSGPVFGTFTLCVTGAVAPVCAAPTALTISNTTGTTATLSFTNNSAGAAYTVTTVPATTTQLATASPISLTGLTLGTTYTVSLVPSCADGTTLPATTTTFTSLPCSAPTSLAVSAIAATTATVSFGASPTATSYTVATTPATTTQTVAASPVALTGLAANTTYVVTITSTCASGNTAAATVAFTTSPVLAVLTAFSTAPVGIAPNPAHGSFTLMLPALAGQRVVQATLLNVLGQAVGTRTIALTATGATAEFDTHALAAGVYVLRLVAGDQTTVLRVAVE